jgi:hypothetical protein
MRPAAPDFELWKKRTKYSIRELAALLDGIDPTAGMSTSRAQGLERLILEAAWSNTIAYERSYKTIARGFFDGAPETRVPLKADVTTQIAKKDAIKWAQSNGIDVSAIA